MSNRIMYFVTFESLPDDRSRDWLNDRFGDLLERKIDCKLNLR